MLIIEKMWKTLLICFNINVRFYIVICVLINYGNYKMQFMSNGFNMSKVSGSTHVPCWELKRCQKNHQPVIMHCVNKIIWYLNLHINNLKLLI